MPDRLFEGKWPLAERFLNVLRFFDLHFQGKKLEQLNNLEHVLIVQVFLCETLVVFQGPLVLILVFSVLNPSILMLLKLSRLRNVVRLNTQEFSDKANGLFGVCLRKQRHCSNQFFIPSYRSFLMASCWLWIHMVDTQLFFQALDFLGTGNPIFFVLVFGEFVEFPLSCFQVILFKPFQFIIPELAKKFSKSLFAFLLFTILELSSNILIFVLPFSVVRIIERSFVLRPIGSILESELLGVSDLIHPQTILGLSSRISNELFQALLFQRILRLVVLINCFVFFSVFCDVLCLGLHHNNYLRTLFQS